MICGLFASYAPTAAFSRSKDGCRRKSHGKQVQKGITFAIEEVHSPKRSLTTTVRTVFENFPVAPVRTNGEIPKEKIPAVMAYQNGCCHDKGTRREM